MFPFPRSNMFKPRDRETSSKAVLNLLNPTRKRKIKIVKPTIKENFGDFLRNSSLHGLKFIGDNRISFYERFFFFISFAICCCIAAYYIWRVYDEWDATPVIIGINPHPTYINEIPFPAITICNMNQAVASKTANVKNGSVEFTILRTLCGRNPPRIGENSHGPYDWSLVQNFIASVAQTCENMFLSCRFGATDVNCSQIFQPVITDEGVCCVFNLVHSKFMYKHEEVFDPFPEFNPPNITPVKWSPEFGYQGFLRKHFYPRPAAGDGIGMGLSVVLDARTDEYYCSSTNGAGFKALLHSPAEIPDIANYGFSLHVGHETQIVINPEIADASDLIRDLNRRYRRCIFANEVNLTYYAIYTRRNCELECDASVHLKTCNCIAYYMPHITQNANVCSIADLNCWEGDMFRTEEIDAETLECSRKCPPACFELKFRPKIFSSQMFHKQFLIRDKVIQKISDEYTQENIVSAHFFYNDRAFRSYTKREFNGITEFLSDTGALMGLFMGFSVLSIMEIVYYLIIRPYFVNYRYKTQLHSAEISEHRRIPAVIDLERRTRLGEIFVQGRFNGNYETTDDIPNYY